MLDHMQCLIKMDKGDGLLDGHQWNTLDAGWYGQIAWQSGLYLASLRAAAEMATDMGDSAFAAECRKIADTGRESIKRLFDQEYFINLIDPKHPDAVNSGTGCEIDQVFGQSWAYQVGLDRVLPQKETRLALQALWRYNFTPDCGAYRRIYKGGRWFTLAGEAGMLMCTFPRKDWSLKTPVAKATPTGYATGQGTHVECQGCHHHQTRIRMRAWLNIRIPATRTKDVVNMLGK
jgi:hypothetical protein